MKRQYRLERRPPPSHQNWSPVVNAVRLSCRADLPERTQPGCVYGLRWRSPAIPLQEARAHAAPRSGDVKGVHTLPVFCWFPVFLSDTTWTGVRSHGSLMWLLDR